MVDTARVAHAMLLQDLLVVEDFGSWHGAQFKALLRLYGLLEETKAHRELNRIGS